MLTPEQIAAARALVADPEGFAHVRAVQQQAFLTLKEAQGCPVTRDRYNRVFGLPDLAADPVCEIDAARRRAIPQRGT